MAKMFPSEENISRLKVSPKEGERCLLDAINIILDDRYEIYYQPFLNGDQPDIIIMRKNSGVMIIEVKDWALSSYYIDDQKQWRLKKNKSIIKSPIAQVKTYKDNLFDLHIENLLERKIENQKFYGIVSCAVYFHKEDKESLDRFLGNRFESDSDKKYIQVFGRDSITPEKLRVIFSKANLYQPSLLFDEEIYKSFRRYLQPPLHMIEQGTKIDLTKKQQKLVISKYRPRQKIKGVAGSGKTLILARRAVNAHKRTAKKVLILTYNITLTNYIHDKISEVREEFNWINFYINNYHNFINAQLNNLGIKMIIPEDLDSWNSEDKTEFYEKNYYSNDNLFEPVKHKIEKYHVILIDELQDYKEEWQTIIRKYFLSEDGEYVVFGDVKQNIYKREVDEYKDFKAVGMPGVWNVLDESFRLSPIVASIAERFQEIFFKDKYQIDNIKVIKRSNGSDIEEEGFYRYLFFEKEKAVDLDRIIDEIFSKIQEFDIHPNDICFLSPEVEILREIDYLIRQKKRENTQVMFETKEVHKKIMSTNDNEIQYRCAKSEIEKIRKNKKANFWMNSGTVKLSTIHSFKGWEIHTLILIIEDYKEGIYSPFSLDELIYTGITRCRRNLIVVNISNSRYHNFFNQVEEIIEDIGLTRLMEETEHEDDERLSKDEALKYYRSLKGNNVDN